MSPALQGFVSDTLAWTAALIALVLLVRRPVARHLGAQAAYALWALPLLRLILPPLVLPAWLAPHPAPEGLTITLEQAPGAAPVAAQAAAAAPPEWTVAWPAVLLGVWLAGAGLFLIVRFSAYFRLRDQLLAEARPVGHAGQVRLVETPATVSPIAFGVLDKVIALPPGFMAMADRTARDLALEHELAHHRGGDLLVNFCVQPLFAFHWFNPLGWYGWRALRHDQEAACDARVMLARADDRAAYAQVIASYAAGPVAALAAPMACPVIGEKSIIHRLRSLTMTNASPRRRFAGRALLGAGLLVLPLTASISYANATDAPLPPAPPEAPLPPAAPLPPVAPVAPVAPMAPVAPEAPEAPAAPDAPDAPDAIAPESGQRVVIIRREQTGDAPAAPGEVRNERRVVIRDDGGRMSKEEREQMMRELRSELDGVDKEMDAARKEVRRAMIELRGKDGVTKVNVDCNGGDGAAWTGEDGKAVTLCTSDVMAQALAGLQQARQQLALNKELPDDIRAEVLKALDEKIRTWKAR